MSEIVEKPLVDTTPIEGKLMRKLIVKSAEEAHSTLFGYLAQEGLFDGSSCALIDLGWHGSIQDTIDTCFGERLGRKGIVGYYFGLDRAVRESSRKYGYLFQHSGSSIPVRYRHIFRVLLELLCLRDSRNDQGVSAESR